MAAAKDQAFESKETYDALAYKLQIHDYKNCECKMKLIPEVAKAQTKMNKIWTVNKVRNEVKKLYDKLTEKTAEDEENKKTIQRLEE